MSNISLKRIFLKINMGGFFQLAGNKPIQWKQGKKKVKGVKEKSCPPAHDTVSFG